MARSNKPYVTKALVDFMVTVFPDRSPEFKADDPPTTDEAANGALIRAGEQNVIRKLASLLKEQSTT